MVTIKDAIEILDRLDGKLKRSPHLAEALREAYAVRGLPEAEPLKNYVEFIVDNPYDWLQSLPAEWTDVTKLRKPRNALIKLAEVKAVVDDLGEDTVDRLLDALDRTCSNVNFHQEVARRSGIYGACGKQDVLAHALREACIIAAQGSMMGDVLAKLWGSGCVPMEEAHVLADVFRALHADKDSIEAFNLIVQIKTSESS